jgi:dolichol-phosphate mannosyltransferase
MFTSIYPQPVLALIAALNEEEGIGLTISDLRRYVDPLSVLVVDGNSFDGTVEVAKSLNADVIRQGGKGKGDAIGSAIRYIDADLKYVVLTDADYTYPAEHVPSMIKILDENPTIGMVCGNRFSNRLDSETMRNAFHFGNRLLALTHNMLNGVTLRDPLTGLRVIRWSILKNWVPRSKGFDIEVELNHHVERQGYGIVEVPIYYRPRLGEKKLKLQHGITIMKRILTESIY